MSLILDALKKAQKENLVPSKNRTLTTNPIIPGKNPSSKRMPLLIILFALSVGLFVYLRYLKKPSIQTIPQPIAAVNPSQIQNTEQLKSEAHQLFFENKLVESQAIWQKLTLLLPTEAEVYNNLGLVLKKLGKKEEATQAYTQALALKKDYPEALNNLGVLLLGDGVKERAKTHFQKAIELNKDYADPYLNLALIFEQEGNLKEAGDGYHRFLELVPNIDQELKKKIQEKMKRLETK